jgi:phosphatidate cytidylyltransferase
VLAFALAVVWLARRWYPGVESGDLEAYATSYVGVMVIAAPLYLLSACLWLPGEAELWLLTVILGSKLNDIGGYLVGSAWGRRRICPGISPNKTWEGSLAGLAMGICGCLYLVTLVDPDGERLTPLRGAALGLALGVTTQLSDTFESAMKRSARVKDSATFIPAFGGILDVVDSLIFAAPVGYTLGVWWLS